MDYQNVHLRLFGIRRVLWVVEYFINECMLEKYKWFSSTDKQRFKKLLTHILLRSLLVGSKIKY